MAHQLGRDDSAHETGSETGTRGKNMRVWRIRELLSAAALAAEGRAMRHCVASYLQSCAAGHVSIWSMTLTTKDGIERQQTVEVTRQRVIVQSRGKRNRKASDRERGVLRRWAAREGLTISRYV